VIILAGNLIFSELSLTLANETSSQLEDIFPVYPYIL
jgi:hypothetical protein